MYKQCKTEESALRQREFESSLLQMLQSAPYNTISVTELCNHVGIARKNFYRYFETKDDALCALLDHTIMDYTQSDHRIGREIHDAPPEIISFLSYWQTQKPLLDALQANGMSTRLIERALAHAWQQDKGFLRILGENANQNTVLFTVSGIFTLIITWHHLGFRQSKEELAADIYRLMTRPIVSIMK